MKQNLIGNKTAKLLLNNLKNTANFSHAYLIHGEDGIGKKTFADMLILSLLCEDTDSKDPCFNCASCKKFLSGSHPDVFILHGKAVQNSIRIDQIRNIRKLCYIKPNESQVSIYLITNAHCMTIEAMNAFLKILEEPPKHAVFILTASSKYALAQTVISRLTCLELFPISNDEIKTYLIENYPDKSLDEINLAVGFSDGVLGKAIAFVTDESYANSANKALDILTALASKNEYEVLRLLNEFDNDKKKFVICLKIISYELRNILLYKEKILTQDDVNIKLANTITKMQTTNLLDFVQEAMNIFNTNANYNLTVAHICAKMHMIVD